MAETKTRARAKAPAAPEILAIPDAIDAVVAARNERDRTKQLAYIAQLQFIEAGKTARRSGVPVTRIGEVVGLSRQQAHRLFGHEPKVDGS